MANPGRVNSFWVMATFTVAMLPQFMRMPVAVAVMTLLPLLWRLGAELRDWRPLPPLLRHALTVMALAVLFVSYGTLSGRRAAVSLLAMMLAFKLIEGFQIRDGRLIVSFSLFLCATQFLFSQDLAMPLYGAAVIRPTVYFSLFLWKIVDVIIIDGTLNGLAKLWRDVSDGVRYSQSGQLRGYATTFAVGVVILIAYFVFGK